MRCIAIVICCSLLSPALAVDIGNITISDTLVVPAGETGDLFGTVTFDGGVIDVQGSLLSNLQRGDIDIIGEGRIELSTADSNWDRRCCYSTIMTIGADVEVLGSPGADYTVGDTINLGVMAAIAGDADDPFRLTVWNDFYNEGVLEARAGALLQLYGFYANQAFNQAGVVRAQPGGVVRYDRGELTSLDGLGAVDNLGKVQFHRTEFQFGGGDLHFPTGEWALVDGAQITNATLSVAAGGRLLVEDDRPFSFNNPQPVKFANVTLASDLDVLGSDISVLGAMSLDQSAIRFTEGSSEMEFASAGSTLSGNGALIADGGNLRLRPAAALFTLPAGVALESRFGTLRLDGQSGDGDEHYDIAGPMTADNGHIEIRTPTTTRGQVTVRNGGVLQNYAPLHNLAAIEVTGGGELLLQHDIQNEGAITITDSTLVIDRRYDSSFEDSMISGPGTFSLRDSLVVTGATMKLAELTSYAGAGVDYGVRERSLDLEGAAIAVGSAPGTRWYVYSGGTLKNGVVNSLDGAELNITAPPGKAGDARATLTDMELNADVRVSVGGRLSLTGIGNGTGQLIVDGGLLEIGVTAYRDITALVASALPRIDASAGQVALRGAIDNRDKTLHLPAGVRWGYSHSRASGIVGGRIEGEPGAELHIDNGYGYDYGTFQEGVTVALPTVVNSTRAYVRGGLTLDETHLTIGLENQSQWYGSQLVFLGDQTLAGVGEVRFGPLAHTPENYIEIEPDPNEATGLTIASGITIRTTEGSGVIRRRYSFGFTEHTPLANYGQLIAENGHRLELYTSDFAQHGTLRSTTDSLLVVHDDGVVNNGRLEIADGQMEFTGDLTQAAGSVLAVELSSELLAAVEGPLLVAGDVVLDGLLELSLVDGFSLTAGDQFALVSAASVSGGFRGIVGPMLDDGLYWQVETLGGEVRLNIATGAPAGDFNSDGVVDAADYALWRENIGAAAGTLPNDPHAGEIGAAQYAIWKANFGAAASTSTTGSAPEPSAMALLVVTATAICSRLSR